MGSCCTFGQPDEKKLDICTDLILHPLGSIKERLQINTNTPRRFNPEHNQWLYRDDYNKSWNSPDSYSSKMVISKTSSFTEHPMEDQILASPINQGKKVGRWSTDERKTQAKGTYITPYLAQDKKQINDIIATNIHREIISGLLNFLTSEDDELKAIAKELITDVVIPTANLSVRNALKRKRIRSLTSLTELQKSCPVSNSVSELISREEKSSRSPPIGNVHVNSILDLRFQSYSNIEDGKQFKKTVELLSEPERHRIIPKKENEIQVEESGLMTEDIDELGKGINKRRISIKQLRRESVNILTGKLSDFVTDYDSLGDIAPTSLQLEKEINRLHTEKTNLRVKDEKLPKDNRVGCWRNAKVHLELLPIVVNPALKQFSVPKFNKPLGTLNENFGPVDESSEVSSID